MRMPSVVVLTDVGSISSAIRVDGEDIQALIVSTDRHQKVTIHANLSPDALEDLLLGLKAQVEMLRSPSLSG